LVYGACVIFGGLTGIWGFPWQSSRSALWASLRPTAVRSAAFSGGFDGRAEARPYLRGNGKANCKGKTEGVIRVLVALKSETQVLRLRSFAQDDTLFAGCELWLCEAEWRQY
jgi:hypothetical protein